MATPETKYSSNVVQLYRAAVQDELNRRRGAMIKLIGTTAVIARKQSRSQKLRYRILWTIACWRERLGEWIAGRRFNDE